jgi:hypothetical protein
MEKIITIRYKLIENIILGKDEKGIDKIFYLNEKISDNNDGNLITINLNDKNYKVLLNMNEVISNINKKIQKIEKEIFEYELKKPPENRNQSAFNLFIFLLQIKLYKEYILNRLFGNIPTDKYLFLKNTYRLDNILIDYLIDLEKANGTISEDKLKIKDFLYIDLDLKNALFSFFKDINIDKQTNQEKIIEIYETFNRKVNYLIFELQNNQNHPNN